MHTYSTMAVRIESTLVHVILYQRCNDSYPSHVHADTRDWPRTEFHGSKQNYSLSFQDRSNAGYTDGRNVGKLRKKNLCFSVWIELDSIVFSRLSDPFKISGRSAPCPRN